MIEDINWMLSQNESLLWRQSRRLGQHCVSAEPGRKRRQRANSVCLRLLAAVHEWSTLDLNEQGKRLMEQHRTNCGIGLRVDDVQTTNQPMPESLLPFHCSLSSSHHVSEHGLCPSDVVPCGYDHRPLQFPKYSKYKVLMFCTSQNRGGGGVFVREPETILFHTLVA